MTNYIPLKEAIRITGLSRSNLAAKIKRGAIPSCVNPENPHERLYDVSGIAPVDIWHKSIYSAAMLSKQLGFTDLMMKFIKPDKDQFFTRECVLDELKRWPERDLALTTRQRQANAVNKAAEILKRME